MCPQNLAQIGSVLIEPLPSNSFGSRHAKYKPETNMKRIQISIVFQKFHSTAVNMTLVKISSQCKLEI